MTYAGWFSVRGYIRGSLWVIPLLGAVLGALLSVGLADVDADWPSQYSPSTAGSVLSAIVGATAALTGFVVTVTILVVQLAIGTFSARYMRLWYRDRMLKLTLAVLLGTLTLSLGLLRRIESDFVPDLGVTVAGALVVVSLLFFLFFFDRFIHRLRPVAVTALAANMGKRAFEESVSAVAAPDVYLEPSGASGAPTLLVHSSRAGSIQALDFDGLVRWARRHDSELVLCHAVGDFVPTGAALIQVHGVTTGTSGDERELRGMIAIGDERTIEQDPAFAVRIMVDVAIRALSPAVNDPTTAVQVIDYLGETLRQIGSSDIGAMAQPRRAMRSPGARNSTSSLGGLPHAGRHGDP